jgi:hypothetical protein
MKKNYFGIGLLALLVVGCGGKAEISGLTSPQVNFQEGKAKLDEALQTPTGGDPTDALLDAVYKIDTAYKQEPTPEKAVAVSVVTTLKIENELSKLFAGSLTRSNDKSANLVAELGRSLAPWKSKQIGLGSVQNPLAYIISLVGSYEPSRAYPNDPTPEQVRSAFTAMEADLRKVVAKLSDENIANLDQAPFTFDDPKSADTSKKVKFGKGEALAMRANAQAFLGVIDLSLSWDFGWTGEFDFGQSLSNAFASSFANQQTINRSVMLPGQPFGQLYAGSNARLVQFKSDWQKGAADAKAALASIKDRPSAGDPGVQWLSESIGYTAPDLDQYSTNADNLAAALNGPVTVVLGDSNATMNIPAFVATPPTLGNLLPDLGCLEINGQYCFQPVAGSYDNTVGGLFPNGVTYQHVLLYPYESRGKLLGAVYQQLW